MRDSNFLKIYGRREKAPTKMVSDGGKRLKVSEYFGCNVFNYEKSEVLTSADKSELREIIATNGKLNKNIAEKYANAVLAWAQEKGATHFCHWFQPLTGSTAEKHDAFLSIEDGQPIEKLSATQLIQGEPDASSFPSGGARTTFEARGYTSWDLTSPVFIRENSEAGRTLCIPTAFVSYHGDALDIKTPLLRSINRVGEAVNNFVALTTGNKRATDNGNVSVTCGCEQEYFLVDKVLYFERPDLVMTGRTLFGFATSRNQQLEDHYFGTIPNRVLAYMQDVEVELYKLGIPAKTRHNEVAPGQFELAPIFSEANVAADQNQLVMAVLKSVAEKHDFVCLLHEKPFAGINGSGKHINWSISETNVGNLLEPTTTPETNYRFLATIATIIKAVYKHGDILRTAIASHGNDHRLGANEAPPSIISIFLGDTLTKILESYVGGETYTPKADSSLSTGADQIATLFQDNTDRNRTSPFAFTGNKFEFRAVGSSAAIGLPVSILNAAVAEAFNEANAYIAKSTQAGNSVEDALKNLIKDFYSEAKAVVFNGDGYSEEWVKEAAKRGLPNLRTTADALDVLTNKESIAFLTEQNVFSANEINMRYNVLLERYIKHREIEFACLNGIISKDILPAAIKFKNDVATAINSLKAAGVTSRVEEDKVKEVGIYLEELTTKMATLNRQMESFHGKDEATVAKSIANELMPLSDEIGVLCAKIGENVPNADWPIPNYYELLFIR